jgi:hypothetical protein
MWHWGARCANGFLSHLDQWNFMFKQKQLTEQSHFECSRAMSTSSTQTELKAFLGNLKAPIKEYRYGVSSQPRSASVFRWSRCVQKSFWNWRERTLTPWWSSSRNTFGQIPPFSSLIFKLSLVINVFSVHDWFICLVLHRVLCPFLKRENSPGRRTNWKILYPLCTLTTTCTPVFTCSCVLKCNGEGCPLKVISDFGIVQPRLHVKISVKSLMSFALSTNEQPNKTNGSTTHWGTKIEKTNSDFGRR